MAHRFDPEQKEDQLRRESQSWDTGDLAEAEPGDIPVIDVSDYFASGRHTALAKTAGELRDACLNVGFFILVGHDFPQVFLEKIFDQARGFFDLPTETKNKILMDSPQWPLKGAGYLPMKNRKLPTRTRGNLNEAFVVKRDHVATLDQNQWPGNDTLPGFRQCVEQYANTMESLAKRLLPVFARALELDPGYFHAAFTRPMRMPSRIPPTMAIDMPRPKACKEISAASWKLFCWTTLTRATSTPDKGGKTKTRSSWPTISQIAAQISSEKTAGIR